MTRQCVSGRRIGSVDELASETSAWATDVTEAQRGIDWQMKIGDARIKLKSVYPKIKPCPPQTGYLLGTFVSDDLDHDAGLAVGGEQPSESAGPPSRCWSDINSLTIISPPSGERKSLYRVRNPQSEFQP